jgi:phospholipid/cholesterol/gamma-HCH transport system ATP-binding protein
MGKALLILRSPDIFQGYWLRNWSRDMLEVRDRFQLRPLFAAVAREQRFYLLGVSEGSVRLFDSTMFRADEVTLPRSVPRSLEAWMNARQPEKFPDELSGGMRRRVGVVTRPPLILYDSPTAGLDPITAYRIVALLIRQRDRWNCTSIVVTHRWQDGYLMANYRHDVKTDRLTRAIKTPPRTRFFVLLEGHIVFQGSLEEMRASSDAYVARFAGRKRSP